MCRHQKETIYGIKDKGEIGYKAVFTYENFLVGKEVERFAETSIKEKEGINRSLGKGYFMEERERKKESRFKETTRKKKKGINQSGHNGN